MSIAVGFKGQIQHLRITDLSENRGWGPPDDFLDAEVVVVLTTRPDVYHGFDLKAADPSLASRLGMLSVLRDAYARGVTVGLYSVFEQPGQKAGRIARVDIGSDVQ